MNIRKLVFGLIILPFAIPIVIAGFLYRIIIASFQTGMVYAVKLAVWIKEGD